MRLSMAGAITLGAMAPLAPAQAQQRISPETWLSVGDFPANGGAGHARLEYDVTADGRAANCHVKYATTPKSVAATTCPLLVERARYVPRHDKTGRAIAWKDVVGIDWSIDPVAIAIPGRTDFGGAIPIGNPSNWMTNDDYPKGMPSSGTLDVDMEFAIGPEGRITACGFKKSLSHPEIGDYSCQLLAGRARFDMPLGRNGEPLATRGRATFHWRRAS